MTFSIIIPVYNVAPYLRECLDSVLAQTYTDWEAICVDDGSTDGSGAILDEYAAKDPRFKVFHQANGGSSAARNRGLDCAIGEWIWFVDADDAIDRESLSIFAGIEQKADLNYFGARVQFQDRFEVEKHPIKTGVLSSEQAIDDLIVKLYSGHIGDVFGWTWDKFIRRSVIEKNRIRFDESISFYEDEVFTIRVAEASKTISSIPNVLYNYRVLNSGLTAKGIPDSYILAKAFFAAGGSFKRDSICSLVNIRVTTMLRTYIHERHSLKAAMFLFDMKHKLDGRFSCVGGYEHMLKILNRMPRLIASALLTGFHFCFK